jgi:hypothetical protein
MAANFLGAGALNLSLIVIGAFTPVFDGLWSRLSRSRRKSG